MSHQLTPPQLAKFELFHSGITVTPEAEALIRQAYPNAPLTLADYASTSGITLVLEDHVWVNVPITTYNPNMVFDPHHELRVDTDRLFVHDKDTGRELPARFVPVPAYHNQRNAHGELFTEYVHTHTDRARISPIRGCAMRCKFCDIPYEFQGRYFPKPIVRLLEAAARAIDDPVQPASHLLISGGTPGKRDYEYLRKLYQCVISAFDGIDVDIMMVPMPEIINLDELTSAGVNQLSLNVELWNRERAAEIMPEKYRQGLPSYLDFIERAVDRLGKGQVRSILMVGLEPAEDTLAGVEALARLGCTPVLSPFRPDPLTELATLSPPSVDHMISTFIDARDVASKYGIKLGPSCICCMHNTISLADGSTDYHYHDRRPRLV
jgi:hypothetical protein